MNTYQVNHYIVALDPKTGMILHKNLITKDFVEASDESEVVSKIVSLYGATDKVGNMYVTPPLSAIDEQGRLVDVNSPNAVSYRAGGFEILPVESLPSFIHPIPVDELGMAHFLSSLVRHATLKELEGFSNFYNQSRKRRGNMDRKIKPRASRKFVADRDFDIHHLLVSNNISDYRLCDVGNSLVIFVWPVFVRRAFKILVEELGDVVEKYKADELPPDLTEGLAVDDVCRWYLEEYGENDGFVLVIRDVPELVYHQSHIGRGNMDRKVKPRASRKFVAWYEYEDVHPLTGKKFTVVRKADVTKKAVEIVEDELISLREENVKLKQLLGKMNREIKAMKYQMSRMLSGEKFAGVMPKKSSVLKPKLLKKKTASKKVVSKALERPAKIRLLASRKKRVLKDGSNIIRVGGKTYRVIAKKKVRAEGKLEKEKGNCPVKWVHYWESLTGDVEHKMTKCMEKCERAGFADDCARFCAAVKDCVLGTTEWRRGRKPKRSSALKRKATVKKVIRISALKKKAQEEGEETPVPEETPPVPENKENPAPEPKKEVEPKEDKQKMSELIVSKIAEALGKSPNEITLKDIYIDNTAGTIQVTFEMEGNILKASAVARKDRLVIKAADRTFTVKFDGKKVVYDIPTKTMNPFPPNPKPEIAVEKGDLPKGVQEIAVEGFDAPKAGDDYPTLAVSASKKEGNDEVVKVASQIVDTLIRKGVVAKEQREDYINFYLKKYNSVDGLKPILSVIEKLESAHTTIVDDRGMPVDLRKIVD